MWSQQERRGAHSLSTGLSRPQCAPDQDGRSRARDTASSGIWGDSPSGPHGLVKFCDAGLTSILFLHSPLHSLQQVVLTKDLNYHHKHEPKAHIHPHVCAFAHGHTHTLTLTQVNNYNTVHDCTERCQTRLAFQLAKQNTFF